jgi:hypothetical protein
VHYQRPANQHFEAISEYYISVTTLISHGFLSVGDENILYETDLN